MWIGIGFQFDHWRYTANNQSIDESLSNWIYGQAPALRRKFRKIGEKATKFNFNMDKTCVKKERNGYWRESDCNNRNAFLCHLPDIPCMRTNLKVSSGKFITDRFPCTTEENCINIDGSYICKPRATSQLQKHLQQVIHTTTPFSPTRLTTWPGTTTTPSPTNSTDALSYSDSSCPTCWVMDPILHKCRPSPEKVSVNCQADSMMLIFDSCLVPSTSQMTLRDKKCLAKTHNEGFYEIETSLDGCGTTIETQKSQNLDGDTNSTIIFRNSLGATAVHNNVIYIASNIYIDFQCSYSTIVKSIAAEMTVQVRYAAF